VLWEGCADRRSRWARRNRTTRTYAIGDMLKCRWNPSCNVRTPTWHCFASVEVVSGRCGPASIMSIASRTAAGRPGSVGAASAWRYGWSAITSTSLCREILMQSRRNAVAAKRFFRKLLKGLRYVPRVLVANKLASYQVAHRELLPSVTHRRSKYLNNGPRNSYQPTRIRERVLKRFASPGQAQRFLFAFSHIRQHFRRRRHLMSAPQC